LIFNEVLPIFQPALGKRFELFARILVALMAVGDAFFLAAKVKGFATFAPLEIDTCSRTWVLFSGIGWATAAENTAGRYSAVIKFQFAHFCFSS
jgi:hypothetical protein